jgi:hypothetical protein
MLICKKTSFSFESVKIGFFGKTSFEFTEKKFFSLEKVGLAEEWLIVNLEFVFEIFKDQDGCLSFFFKIK